MPLHFGKKDNLQKSTFQTLMVSIAFLSLWGCASVGAPTGGPIDKIPPRLIFSSPKDQQINFQEQHLEFAFDEPIKVQALKKNLSITPDENQDYRFKAFKNKLTLDFEEPFSKKTTYIFDFGEAISDMTENNKLRNFRIAFSTGEYIDSLFVEGKVRHLLSQTRAKNCRVGLYDTEDTLDIQIAKPKYFAQTDTAGKFKITNIRPSKYKLYALLETEKQDFKYNSSTEYIAFDSALVELIDIGKTDYELNLTKYDLDTFRLKTARPKRHYFEVNTNKPIAEADVKFADSTYDSVFFYKTEGITLRFFNKNLDKTDSIQTFLTLKDTSENVIRDTIAVYFNAKRSKTSHPFDFTVTPASGTTFHKADSFQLQFDFSAPVAQTFTDSLTYRIGSDTLDNRIDSTQFVWNTPRTQLKIRHWFRMDSALNVQVHPKMFASFEKDSTSERPLQYSLQNVEDFGEISGEVRSEYPSFEFQLLDANGNIERKLQNPKTFHFDFLRTGRKKIRILIDSNENGIWENGDFHTRIPPEEVRIFHIEQELKAGWMIEDVFIEIKKEPQTNK